MLCYPRTSARRPAPVLALAVLLGACGPAELAWFVTFDESIGPAELDGQRWRIEARIQTGACTGGEAVYAVEFGRGEPAMGLAPPELAAGTYCFSARAIGDDCQIFAEGFSATELPKDEVEVRLLRPARPASICGVGERCLGGECLPACRSGQADCDSDGTCETDLGTDLNCGACDDSCTPFSMCVEGLCCLPGTGPGMGIPCVEDRRAPERNGER